MYEQCKELEIFLTPDFETKLLRAGCAYLENSNDPLRFNSFCCAMRELCRHVLARLSPEEQITQCSWFQVETKDGRSTRAQKVKYAIQGGLDNQYVQNILNIDIEPCLKKVRVIHDSVLSKYIHVSQETFNIEDFECKKLSFEIIIGLREIFSLIDEAKKNLRMKLENSITQKLINTFIFNTLSDIDILSTHSCVEYSFLEEWRICDINAKEILLSGYGTVVVSLNYGNRNDFATLEEQFPFQFTGVSPIAKPENIKILPEEILIDTSSWWGEGKT